MRHSASALGYALAQNGKARLHSLEPFVHPMNGGWFSFVMRLKK